MAAWPGTLPDLPLTGSFRRVAQDNVLRFSPDVGDDIRRRRTTAKSVNDTFQMVLTQAQVVILDDFYADDCYDGAVSFTYTDPITETTKTFAWAAPYEIEEISTVATAPLFRATLALIRQAE